jgi:hypothetical protein
MRPSEPVLAAPVNSDKRSLWRRVFSFPVLLGVLVAAGGYVASSWGGIPGGKIYANDDSWFHIAVGRFILETHRWPHAEMWSFTAAGVPYIAHQWLGQAAIALPWGLAGLQGLAALLILWVVLFTLLLYGLAYLRSGNAKAAAVITALLLPVVGPSFTLRPQLPGYCFFLLTLIGLEFALKGRTWVLALFPPLFLVWVNTHGSFVLGFVVMGVYALAGMFDFRCPWLQAERWPASLRRKFGLSALGSVLALWITPYGGRIAAYPLDFALHQKLLIAISTEWRSILEVHGVGQLVFLVVVLALFVVSNYFLRPICYPLRDATLLAGTVVESCLHVRMLAFFAVVFAPVSATILARFMPKFEPKKDKPMLNALFIIGILAACVASFPSRQRLERFLELKYPVGTVAYLRAHPSLRPVFHRAEWGGFLIHSGVKVFIEGHLDVFLYGGILPDYFAIIEPTPDAESLLRRYSIRACLLEKETPLAEFLERRPDWRLVSSDRVGVLFEYEGSSAAAIGSGAIIGRGRPLENVQ